MRNKLQIAVAAAGLFVVATTAWAHHSFNAEFDGSKPITLKGKVVKMEWVNPHSWITMEVVGPDGKVVTWKVEAGAPNALFRRGFRRDSLPVGSEILVDGFLAKDGSNKANGRDLTFKDGQKLFMGSSGTGAPYDAEKK